MYQETEVQSDEVMICSYHLRVVYKDSGQVILNRYITTKELGKQLFDEQVNIYHNIPKRVIIMLYDLDKCTNIEYYDSDDNI